MVGLELGRPLKDYAPQAWPDPLEGDSIWTSVYTSGEYLWRPDYFHPGSRK